MHGGYSAKECDSSEFTWKDAPDDPGCCRTLPYPSEKAGCCLKRPNKDIATMYHAAIKTAYETSKEDIIFTSMHTHLLNFMKAENIPFTIAYPSKDRCEEFRKRYIEMKMPFLVKILISGKELDDTQPGDCLEFEKLIKVQDDYPARDGNPRKLKMSKPGSYLQDYVAELGVQGSMQASNEDKHETTFL